MVADPFSCHTPVAGGGTETGPPPPLVPVPERFTVALPPSVTSEMDPVDEVAAVGVNVTVAVTLAPATICAFAAGRPVAENGADGPVTDVTVIVALPAFLIVTVDCELEPTVTLPNGTEVGVTESTGAAAEVPVPDNDTVALPP